MTRRGLAALFSALLLVLTVHGSAWAKPKHDEGTSVGGGWLGEVSCLPTDPQHIKDLEYDPNDPTKGTFTCTTSATYDGSWAGQAEGTLSGTIDLGTGETYGVADEVFTGTYTGEEGSSGTLHLLNTFTIEPGTGWFHNEAQILGGTDSFAGSSGTVHFDGYQGQTGGYSGTWYRNAASGGGHGATQSSPRSDRHPVGLAKRKPSGTSIGGAFVEPIDCFTDPRDFKPENVKFDPNDPSTVTATCNSTATYTGSWAGQTEANATSTMDLDTFDIQGVATETFIGTYTGEQGSHGSITFSHVFTIDGTTGWFHVDTLITGGTDDFAGSSGTMRFDGYEAAHGGYSGTWYRG